MTCPTPSSHSLPNTPPQHRPPAGVRELSDALLAYSKRHYARVDRLLRSTYLLDYTLASMKVCVCQCVFVCV